MTIAAPDARQAATVIIVRDHRDGPPDILLMERAASMAFAPGALVFPGGAVDAADLTFARQLDSGLPLDEAAARVAAVRETLEESGLGLGFPEDVDVARLAKMRAGLARGASLGDILADEQVSLDLLALTPFARWQPAAFEGVTRIFDTRFYLARAPQGQEARADATENVDLRWSSAAAALARCDAGEGRVIFPTRRNLERLADHGSYADIVSHAIQIAPEKITPWIEARADGRYLCIPDYLGYPITSEPLDSASRH